MEPGRFSLFTGAILLCFHVAQPGIPSMVTPKRGFCPDISFTCPVLPLPLCWQDADCRGFYKCCFFNCQLQCVKPLKILHRGRNPFFAKPEIRVQ